MNKNRRCVFGFGMLSLVAIFCNFSLYAETFTKPMYATKPTHPNLVDNAINYYKINGSYFNEITIVDINNMKQGSIDEDYADKIPPYMRAFHHFYDYSQRNNSTEGGLSNIILGSYSSAKKWALSQSDSDPGGIHTWDNSISKYKTDRNAAFLDLGHILHLIQDMTVPAHTRNDIHIGVEYIADYDPYENFVEGLFNNKLYINSGGYLTDIADGNTHILAGTTPLDGFIDIRSIFDYLSKFTQENFFSDDTIDSNIFPSPIKDFGHDEVITNSPYGSKYNGTFYFYYGNVVDGVNTVSVRLAYRSWFWGDTTKNIYVNQDYYKILAKKAMVATAGVVKLYLQEVNKNSSSPPSVQTVAATLMMANGATLNGNVNPNGLATNYWFEYGTSSSLDTYSSTSTKSAGSGTTSQSFSEAIRGLQAGTTYYFRVAASSGSGTALGAISSFSTTSGASTTWSKTYGGTKNEWASAIRQTSDGGYIIVGGTDIIGSVNSDVYLIKTDSTGTMLWSKTYGGTAYDVGLDVRETLDLGFIIVGQTSSFGDNLGDVYLIKTDSNGNKIWSKTIGGSQSDFGYSVRQTLDGGYIIAGYTASYGLGNGDMWLIKTDSSGNTIWGMSYGGVNTDYATSVEQTLDGGYILAGGTYSFGSGDCDVLIIKTDSIGNMLWSKTFGGTNTDYGFYVQQTSDKGYIIAGTTFSYGAGGGDVYLIKTDSNGNALWSKTYGGVNEDRTGTIKKTLLYWSWYKGYVQQTTDGGYFIAGTTFSFGAGNGDVYVIKTDSNGNALWEKTYGAINTDEGHSAQQTSDGGYIIAGSTTSFGVVGTDVHLIKTDPNGNIK